MYCKIFLSRFVKDIHVYEKKNCSDIYKKKDEKPSVLKKRQN